MATRSTPANPRSAGSSVERARAGLAKLRTDAPHRPLMSQVAELLPDIEAALASGIGYAQVAQTLQRSGLQVSTNTLKSYLYRLRLARRTAAGAGPAGPTPAPSPAPPAQPVRRRAQR